MDLPNRNESTPTHPVEYDELHMPYNKNKKPFYRSK